MVGGGGGGEAAGEDVAAAEVLVMAVPVAELAAGGFVGGLA